LIAALFLIAGNIPAKALNDVLIDDQIFAFFGTWQIGRLPGNPCDDSIV